MPAATFEPEASLGLEVAESGRTIEAAIAFRYAEDVAAHGLPAALFAVCVFYCCQGRREVGPAEPSLFSGQSAHLAHFTGLVEKPRPITWEVGSRITMVGR